MKTALTVTAIVVLYVLLAPAASANIGDFNDFTKYKLVDVQMSDGLCDITCKSADGKTCGFAGPFMNLTFLMNAYKTSELIGIEDTWEGFSRKIHDQVIKLSDREFALSEMELAFFLDYLPRLNSSYMDKVVKAENPSELNKLMKDLAERYKADGVKLKRKNTMSYNPKTRVLTMNYEKKDRIPSLTTGEATYSPATRQAQIISKAPYFEWIVK